MRAFEQEKLLVLDEEGAWHSLRITSLSTASLSRSLGKGIDESAKRGRIASGTSLTSQRQKSLALSESVLKNQRKKQKRSKIIFLLTWAFRSSKAYFPSEVRSIFSNVLCNYLIGRAHKSIFSFDLKTKNFSEWSPHFEFVSGEFSIFSLKFGEMSGNCIFDSVQKLWLFYYVVKRMHVLSTLKI